MTAARIRSISTTVVAAVIIVLGIRLGQYAEADDAPGGVVIAAVMILGALLLAVSPFWRKK